MTPQEREARRASLVKTRCQLLATDFIDRAADLGIDLQYLGAKVSYLSTMYENRDLTFRAGPFHGGMPLLQEKLELLEDRPLMILPTHWERDSDGRVDVAKGFGLKAIVQISPWEDQSSPLQDGWYLSADGVVTEGPFPTPTA